MESTIVRAHTPYTNCWSQNNHAHTWNAILVSVSSMCIHTRARAPAHHAGNSKKVRGWRHFAPFASPNEPTKSMCVWLIERFKVIKCFLCYKWILCHSVIQKPAKILYFFLPPYELSKSIDSKMKATLVLNAVRRRRCCCCFRFRRFYCWDFRFECVGVFSFWALWLADWLAVCFVYLFI